MFTGYVRILLQFCSIHASSSVWLRVSPQPPYFLALQFVHYQKTSFVYVHMYFTGNISNILSTQHLPLQWLLVAIATCAMSTLQVAPTHHPSPCIPRLLHTQFLWTQFHHLQPSDDSHNQAFVYLFFCCCVHACVSTCAVQVACSKLHNPLHKK